MMAAIKDDRDGEYIEVTVPTIAVTTAEYELNQLRARIAELEAEVARIYTLDLATLERDKATLQARIWELDAELEAAQPTAKEHVWSSTEHRSLVSLLILQLSAISERNSAAQWHIGVEYGVWYAIHRGCLGMWWLVEPEIANLKLLSHLIGGWVEWLEDANEPQFIPMAAWQRKYDDWRETLQVRRKAQEEARDE